MAKLLGADSFFNFGIGGSGHVSGPAYSTRLTDMLACSPDIVIIQGSRNDGTAASQTIQDAMAANLPTLASMRRSTPPAPRQPPTPGSTAASRRQ